MLVQATTIITSAKRYADANDPNAGAWLPTAAWQEWLDSVYRVLYDRLLFCGSLTPIPVDTTFSYDPAVGYMTLASSACRALVDVFCVRGSGTGARYELVPSGQHQRQYPNLDLLNNPAPWYPLGAYGSGFLLPSRAWSAFVTTTGDIRVQVMPKQTPETYLIRTVADPDVSGGYQMPPVAEDWMALCMAKKALASEGVTSAAIRAEHREAEDALQGYLDTFQLHNGRKVTTAPWESGSAWGEPGRWWWRT